jgi:cold shock protein
LKLILKKLAIFFSLQIFDSINVQGVFMRGTVKWFNDAKGYGFINDESGKQYFVHWKAISTISSERRFLLDGEAVEFDTTTGEKGEQAINVVRLNP